MNLNFGAGQPASRAVVSGVYVSGDYPSQTMHAFVMLEEKMSQLIDQLANIKIGSDKSVENQARASDKSPKNLNSPRVSGDNVCYHCKKAHNIWKCVGFKNATLLQKQRTVNAVNLCRVCLNTGHQAFACRSNSACKTCNGRHHTFLHTEETQK